MRRITNATASAGMREFLRDGLRRIVESDWTIRRAVDELPNERILRRADLVGRTFRDDASVRDKVDVIDDLQRFVNVVRDDDRCDTERIVQLADQLADDAERTGVQS